MKKLFTILGLVMIAAFVLSSCKSNTASQAITTSDTVGLAAFRDWKIQQYQQAMTATEPAIATTPVVAKAPVKTRTVYRKSNSNSGSMNTASTHTAQTAPAKKGWSKAAKGAVIGGASGAVLGAVINKRNRVVGGVVGGVIGGGIGYGIGRAKDKKDGRY